VKYSGFSMMVLALALGGCSNLPVADRLDDQSVLFVSDLFGETSRIDDISVRGALLEDPMYESGTGAFLTSQHDLAIGESRFYPDELTHASIDLVGRRGQFLGAETDCVIVRGDFIPYASWKEVFCDEIPPDDCRPDAVFPSGSLMSGYGMIEVKDFESCTNLDIADSSSLEETNATLIEILADRDRYDKQRIQISGYFCSDGRTRGIFLSRQDCVDQNVLVAFGIYGEGIDFSEIEEGQYITVRGTFQSSKGMVVLHYPYQQGRIQIDTLFPF